MFLTYKPYGEGVFRQIKISYDSKISICHTIFSCDNVLYISVLLFRSLVHGSSESSIIKKSNSGSGIKLNEEVQDTNNDWDCDGGDDNDFSLRGDDFEPHTAQGVNINYLLLLSTFIDDFFILICYLIGISASIYFIKN